VVALEVREAAVREAAVRVVQVPPLQRHRQLQLSIPPHQQYQTLTHLHREQETPHQYNHQCQQHQPSQVQEQEIS